jgi:nitrogen regulatory protein PII
MENQFEMVFAIVNSGYTDDVMAAVKECGATGGTILNARGTANTEIEKFFGISISSEKELVMIIIPKTIKENVLKAIYEKVGLNSPGQGIAFTVPLSSIGGKKALNYLTNGQNYIKGEESTLKDTKYELLVAIANQGYTELIMDAARKVHASGGTVIHAKGTGSQRAEQFLGVTLVPEKEIIFIVVKKDRKNDIMRSIMDEAGTGTKAGTIVFSLPVTDTAGMRLMESIDEEGGYD